MSTSPSPPLPELPNDIWRHILEASGSLAVDAEPQPLRQAVRALAVGGTCRQLRRLVAEVELSVRVEDRQGSWSAHRQGREDPELAHLRCLRNPLRALARAPHLLAAKSFLVRVAHTSAATLRRLELGLQAGELGASPAWLGRAFPHLRHLACTVGPPALIALGSPSSDDRHTGFAHLTSLQRLEVTVCATLERGSVAALALESLPGSLESLRVRVDVLFRCDLNKPGTVVVELPHSAPHLISFKVMGTRSCRLALPAVRILPAADSLAIRAPLVRRCRGWVTPAVARVQCVVFVCATAGRQSSTAVCDCLQPPMSYACMRPPTGAPRRHARRCCYFCPGARCPVRVQRPWSWPKSCTSGEGLGQLQALHGCSSSAIEAQAGCHPCARTPACNVGCIAAGAIVTVGCEGVHVTSDDLQRLHAWRGEYELSMRLLHACLCRHLDSPITGRRSVQAPAQWQAPCSLTVAGAWQCSTQLAKCCVPCIVGCPPSLQAPHLQPPCTSGNSAEANPHAFFHNAVGCQHCAVLVDGRVKAQMGWQQYYMWPGGPAAGCRQVSCHVATAQL